MPGPLEVQSVQWSSDVLRSAKPSYAGGSSLLSLEQRHIGLEDSCRQGVCHPAPEVLISIAARREMQLSESRYAKAC